MCSWGAYWLVGQNITVIMSIRGQQEICLNVSKIRCLATHPAGRYSLRFHIYQQNKNYQKVAVPISVIESAPAARPLYEINDYSYTTKPFLMKLGGEVHINEMCIFKNEINIFKYEPDFHEIVLTLLCELILSDPQRERVVGSFEGKIRGDSVNEALVVDFHEVGACQVLGSIHSCVYQFAYSATNEKIQNFEAYCETQSKQYVQSLLEYLLEQSKKSNQKIKSFLQALTPILNVEMTSSILSFSQEEDLTKSRPPPRQIQEEEEQVSVSSVKGANLAKSEVKELRLQTEIYHYGQEFGNRVTEEDEAQERNVDLFKNVKKKRRKIFISKSSSSANSQVSIEEFERILHENAITIYTNWRTILKLMMEEQGAIMVEAYLIQYRQRLNRLICESVVRFKGSWDIDFYANEESQRNKMALQIRSQAKENEKYANEFRFYNSEFFAGCGPVLFQETVPREIKLEERPNDGSKYLIVLVHGLGACRIDMERIKVQLKRYYQSDVCIMVSSSNEARTEGDIDNMGLRLANQIGFQLAKMNFKPKVCLIGHSMGGVIIRSALPRLEKYADLFHSFVSLSSPHIGYNYSSSKLVDAGLWVINSWKKCQSILQLTMADAERAEDSFIYRLSSNKGLEWFKKVTFIGSHQDLYVPYYSARVQKHEQCILDEKNKMQKALIYNQMIDNILNKVQGELNRIDVNFFIPEQNFDNLIGRAAHINFVSNPETVRLLCLAGQSIIF